MRTAKKSQRKRGGQPGGCNAMKHGLHGMDRHGLILGDLPRSVKQVTMYAAKFRKALEGLVLLHKGTVSVTDQCHITTAARWERHASLCNRWLRQEYEKLTAAERLAYSKAVAEGSTNRDRSVERLGLDKEEVANTMTLSGYLEKGVKAS